MTKHIHKYIRAKLGGAIIYKCDLVGCSHYILKQLIIGRVSICNRCDNTFPITIRTLKNCPAKPHCEDCYPKSEDDKKLDKAIDILIGD